MNSEPAAKGLLRVLLVTPRFHPHSGGLEIHTREVARRLSARGHAVTVLTTDTTGRQPPVEQLEGYTIVRARAWSAGLELHFAPGVYRTIAGQPGWDIIHVEGFHTLVAPLAMLAALRARIPYVVTFHGGGHSSRLRHAIRGPQRKLLAPLFARANRLIALSEFELVLFGDELGIPRDRFAMIPNGADLPAGPEPDGPPEPNGLRIASIGRLERYKGHQRVLAALPAILRQRPDARLWIAGFGPYEAHLRRLAAQLGVADRVEIRGVPASERGRYRAELAGVALVVLLSEYETQPLAILEALALGRPALVAHTSGLSELARHSLVRAIDLRSTPDQIASAVLESLGRSGPPPVLNLPTWDECTARLEQLYVEVVRTTRS